MPSSEETPAPPFSIVLGFSALIRNPTAGSVFLIGGPIIPDQPIKDGSLPASKASIEAMPTVEVTELGFECAICLGECGVGEEVKEMPCKHRYHSGCIEKWLGIHGSCPVCRYKMPVEEESQGKGKEVIGAREEMIFGLVFSSEVVGEIWMGTRKTVLEILRVVKIWKLDRTLGWNWILRN